MCEAPGHGTRDARGQRPGRDRRGPLKPGGSASSREPGASRWPDTASAFAPVSPVRSLGLEAGRRVHEAADTLGLASRSSCRLGDSLCLRELRAPFTLHGGDPARTSGLRV